MRNLGASEEEIEEILGDGEEDERFEVWPENWPALELFLKCRQQFAVGPMGGVLGLRAEGAEAVMRMNRVKLRDQAALFDDLQVMVDAAATVLNRKDE